MKPEPAAGKAFPTSPLDPMPQEADTILARLSASQQTCLRLVAQGMSSKEIAQTTGLAPLTVDTYLKQAMALLRAPNRREAARLFARIDPSQKSGSPPRGVEQPAPERPQTGATAPGELSSILRLPPLGGAVNDLGATQKTLRILQVMAVATTVGLAIVLVLAGILKIVH